jgi:5-methylcytosine-specific restriction endonuclease McrA
MSAADDYRRFLLSNTWREKRKLVLRRDGWRCAICGSGDVPLHVHHLTYSSPWGAEPLRDLLSVCSEHHHAMHTHSAWPTTSVTSWAA